VFLAARACSPAHATQVVDVAGSLEHLADVALKAAHSADPPILNYRLNLEGIDTVRINVSDSRRSGKVLYRDNCVATRYDRTVDCDLKMLDDLIDDFALLEVYGHGSQTGLRQEFRKGLLIWILAHEFGHIALGHDYGDYEPALTGMQVFDLAGQAKELAADAFSIRLVNQAKWDAAVGTLLDVTNALLRRSVCPDTFPKVCKRMPAGVGVIYDYTSGAAPIRIHLSGSHPDFIARFLRIIYLEGKAGGDLVGLSHEAAQAIALLRIEVGTDRWETVDAAFGPLTKNVDRSAPDGGSR
jgi:hypothetical protein